MSFDKGVFIALGLMYDKGISPARNFQAFLILFFCSKIILLKISYLWTYAACTYSGCSCPYGAPY